MTIRSCHGMYGIPARNATAFRTFPAGVTRSQKLFYGDPLTSAAECRNFAPKPTDPATPAMWARESKVIYSELELTAEELAQDAALDRSRETAKAWSLIDSADSISDAATRQHVSSLIYSAIVNANDTIDADCAATDGDWGSLFRGNLQLLLDCGGESITPQVTSWFIAASRAAMLEAQS